MPEFRCEDCGKRLFHENETTLEVEKQFIQNSVEKLKEKPIVICTEISHIWKHLMQKEKIRYCRRTCIKKIKILHIPQNYILENYY